MVSKSKNIKFSQILPRDSQSIEPVIDTRCVFRAEKKKDITVEPRYNDPRYNDIPGITINMLCPGKSYSKMYGTEPRYNDLRYNDIPDITMSF